MNVPKNPCALIFSIVYVPLDWNRTVLLLYNSCASMCIKFVGGCPASARSKSTVFGVVTTNISQWVYLAWKVDSFMASYIGMLQAVQLRPKCETHDIIKCAKPGGLETNETIDIGRNTRPMTYSFRDVKYHKVRNVSLQKYFEALGVGLLFFQWMLPLDKP